MSDDEVDLKDKLIDQAKSAGCKKAWDLYESCKTRVTVGEHAGNAEVRRAVRGQRAAREAACRLPGQRARPWWRGGGVNQRH